MRGPEGKTAVVKPIRWSMDTGATLMRTSAELGSRALEEPSSAVHDQVEEKIELESTSAQLEGEDKESDPQGSAYFLARFAPRLRL